ncbi:MAG: aminoacyl-tRNA hydrolase [Acidobacteriota bacterium]
MAESTSGLARDRRESERIIIGLGNPGARYAETRHNVGFRVVAELARRHSVDLDSLECNALVASRGSLTLAAPQTFMNRSGFAARCLRERRGIEPGAILIVYDEIHLSLGTLRLRRGGSPAGHRGLESVLENLGTDQVPRLRLGVAGESGPPTGESLVDFVLEPFAESELEQVEALIVRAADACEAWAAEGPEAAMQRFNGPPPS